MASALLTFMLKIGYYNSMGSVDDGLPNSAP